MSEGRPASGTIHIAVAVIGLVGSLAVAWMTTGAKFNQELDGKAGEVARLRRDVETAQERLRLQQQDLDRKVSAVEDRLQKLDAQIEIAQAAADKLLKAGGGLFGGRGKK
jgi:hypothetical protein